MRRRCIEVVVELLDVLAVIALAVREAEQTLFQNRILAVPQRQRQTQALLVIAETGEAVLAPAIDAAARVIVREVVPRVAMLAVVLADGAPLAFAEVWTPLFPRELVRRALPEACALGQTRLSGGSLLSVCAPCCGRRSELRFH